MIDPDLALQLVRGSKVISFDTETTGLTVNDIPCGYVFADFENATYIPVRHAGGGNIPMIEEFERELSNAFAERCANGYRTVGHFLGFDLRASLRVGLEIRGTLEDTAINESLIDDLTRGYSLEDCAKRHKITIKFASELYRELARRFGGLPDRTSMAHFYKMPGDHDLVVDYATGDGISTLELWESQQAILDNERLRVPWTVECALIPHVARLHHRGMRVDKAYADRITGEINDKVKELNKKFSPGFNVRSPKDVEKLYRANGFQDHDFDRTDSGGLSFTEKWLETNEIGGAILEVRRMEKARDSFVTPLIAGNNKNGRVHPILHQSKSDEYGVAGSRFSCSDPNMQAFPKRNKTVGKVVRKLIIPDDGFEMYEADVSQHEPRLFTHYSGEPMLVKGYTDNTIDIHDAALQQLGMKDRDTAKRMAMGMLTGMQAKALAGHMRWDIPTAKAAHRKFLEDAFPCIGKFQKDAKDVFAERRYVKSILGRKARLDSSRFAYRAVSRIIQNSAGDHLKYMMLKACEFEEANSESLQLFLTIHDSFIFQSEMGNVDVVREMIALMEDTAQRPPFNFIIPIPFEVCAGANWAEASYGEKIKDKRGWKI